MGTVVTMHVVGHGRSAAQRAERESAVERAVEWFEQVTRACSRFDAQSELSRLSARAGAPVAVSPVLFELIRFALGVAEETEGAFDPTVGHRMRVRGFDEEFRRGERAPAFDADSAATWRDIFVDEERRTVTLGAPLVLDLGAVAKGFAVDMAARELQRFEHFAIDAGGDLYLAGNNANGEPWSVGIRHPRDPQRIVETLRISNAAVCTSGDYEKTGADGHHILDTTVPTSVSSATSVVSSTVIAPTTMVADALSTAAFVLGPLEGIAFLERQGVDGFMLTPELERVATPRMRQDFFFAAPFAARAQ